MRGLTDQLDVVCYCTRDGKCPVVDDVKALRASNVKGFNNVVSAVGRCRRDIYRTKKPLFETISASGLSEIKAHSGSGLRLLAAVEGRYLVLLSIDRKRRTTKFNKSNIPAGERLLEDWRSRKGDSGRDREWPREWTHSTSNR